MATDTTTSAVRITTTFGSATSRIRPALLLWTYAASLLCVAALSVLGVVYANEGVLALGLPLAVQLAAWGVGGLFLFAAPRVAARTVAAVDEWLPTGRGRPAPDVRLRAVRREE